MSAGLATRAPLTIEQRRVRSAWWFVAPMIVALVAVAGWPLTRTFWFSVTDANFSDLSVAQFIGIDNFTDLLADPVWWSSVRNTLVFTFVSVLLETVLGLIVALILNSHFPMRGAIRAAVLVPWAIPTVVSAQLWNWMYHDVFGIINESLIWMGVLDHPVAWIANPHTNLWAIVAVDVWKTTPFMALLLLAGLQQISAEVYEAARVDGIHPVKVFFRITLPLLKPALLVAVIFRVLDAMRVFDVIYVMTGNNQTTMSISVYARQQLVDFQNVGMGSAAATLLFALIAIIAVIYITAARIGKET
jgi:trehalose/maltose transport system permease protein